MRSIYTTFTYSYRHTCAYTKNFPCLSWLKPSIFPVWIYVIMVYFCSVWCVCWNAAFLCISPRNCSLVTSAVYCTSSSLSVKSEVKSLYFSFNSYWHFYFADCVCVCVHVCTLTVWLWRYCSGYGFASRGCLFPSAICADIGTKAHGKCSPEGSPLLPVCLAARVSQHVIVDQNHGWRERETHTLPFSTATHHFVLSSLVLSL